MASKFFSFKLGCYKPDILQKKFLSNKSYVVKILKPFFHKESMNVSAVFCFRWLALFLSLKASYRLHHMRSWVETEGEKQQVSHCLKSRDFLLDVNFPLSFPNLHSCTLLQVSHISVMWTQQQFLVSEKLWKPFYPHETQKNKLGNRMTFLPALLDVVNISVMNRKIVWQLSSSHVIIPFKTCCKK